MGEKNQVYSNTPGPAGKARARPLRTASPQSPRPDRMIVHSPGKKVVKKIVPVQVPPPAYVPPLPGDRPPTAVELAGSTPAPEPSHAPEAPPEAPPEVSPEAPSPSGEGSAKPAE